MSSIKKDLSNSIYFLNIVIKTPAGNGQGLFCSPRTLHSHAWIFLSDEYLQAGINYSLY